jgi:hypothetical protein
MTQSKKQLMLDNYKAICGAVVQAEIICGKSGDIECAGGIRECPFRYRSGKDKYCSLTILSEETIL